MMDLSTQTVSSILKGEVLVDNCRQETLSSLSSIDYIIEPISYDTFFRNYLLPNKLCVLGSWVTAAWQSRKDWVTKDGTLNFSFLKEHFGEIKCPVANCNHQKYNSHPKCEMLTSDYLKYLEDMSQEQPQETNSYPAQETSCQVQETSCQAQETSCQAQETSCQAQETNSYPGHETNSCPAQETNSYPGHETNSCPAQETNSCLYLKDWHFQKLFPDYEAYTVPVFFKSDWMNEYWDHRNDVHDDFRFVYIGPKGSWTPFHSDVFRSYSWSANICGRKKWIFFPPGEEVHLRDKHGQLIFDLTSPELQDRSRFPDVGQIQKSFEVYQEAGEVVFVPSGWHHQVFNLENTISINHNWLNGCNVDLCWTHLLDSLKDVQKEIQDCRDMNDWGHHCQVILKASAGMDFAEFYLLLCTVAQNRLSDMDAHFNDVSGNSVCLSPQNSVQPTILKGLDHVEHPEQWNNMSSTSSAHSSKFNIKDSEPSAEFTIQSIDSNAQKTKSKHSARPSTCTPTCGSTSASDGSSTLSGQYITQGSVSNTHRAFDGQEKNTWNHHLFDLYRIQGLVHHIKQNKEFLELDLDKFEIKPEKLIEKIVYALESCGGNVNHFLVNTDTPH